MVYWLDYYCHVILLNVVMETYEIDEDFMYTNKVGFQFLGINTSASENEVIPKTHMW